MDGLGKEIIPGNVHLPPLTQHKSVNVFTFVFLKYLFSLTNLINSDLFDKYFYITLSLVIKIYNIFLFEVIKGKHSIK